MCQSRNLFWKIAVQENVGCVSAYFYGGHKKKMYTRLPSMESFFFIQLPFSKYVPGSRLFRVQVFQRPGLSRSRFFKLGAQGSLFRNSLLFTTQNSARFFTAFKSSCSLWLSSLQEMYVWSVILYEDRFLED